MTTNSDDGQVLPKLRGWRPSTDDSTAGLSGATVTSGSDDTASTRRAGEGWHPDRGTALFVAVAGLLAAAVMYVMHDAIIDDGYISMVYARTLADHFQWGMLPGTPANTATSPLNVMILAAITVVVRDPMVALWVVTIVNAMVLALGLARLGAQWGVGLRFAWVAFFLLLLDPVLASSLGLETMMTVTLLVWLLSAACAFSWKSFGWLAGIGLVLRPDMVVIIGVVWLFAFAFRRANWLRTTWGIAWRTALLGLPWYVFSWFYFGSAIPDTLAIKQQQGWGDYATGLWHRYGTLYHTATLGALLLAGLGGVALLSLPAFAASRYKVVLLSVASAGIAGLAYYGVYAEIHVPPYPWYYGIPIAGLSLSGAWLIAALAQLPLVAGRTLASSALAAVLCVAVLGASLVAWGHHLYQSTPMKTALIHGNWASPEQYKRIGLDLAKRFPNDPVIRSAGEFGTILYYCDCNIIDRFDNRSLIMDRLIKQRNSSLPMRINYLWFDRSKYPQVRQDFHLLYSPHHTTVPRDWNVQSPTKGPGHYSVVKGPKTSDVTDGLTPP